MRDAVIIMGEMRPFTIKLDGKKKVMKGHFVVGAYDGNEFSGTEYDAINNELGQCRMDKTTFAERICKFNIIRGER